MVTRSLHQGHLQAAHSSSLQASVVHSQPVPPHPVLADRLRGSAASASRRCSQQTRLKTVVRYQAVYTPAKVVDKPEEKEELLPLPRATENVADDATLHNPLKRMERLSTGWFGVILEYDGVLVQDTFHLNVDAWNKVATEFDKPRPLGQTIKRIKGVQDDLVVRSIFKWTQNPSVSHHIAKRKGEIYDELVGEMHPLEVPEARPFLETLKRYNVPMALVTAHPEAKVLNGLQKLNMRQYFDALITAEDSGAPEVEFSLAMAAQKIQRPPPRCIVVGESNKSVEAAHEVGMKCVVVTGNKPVYDFVGADLVVRNLSQLSFINLKRLFGNEDLVESKLNVDSLQQDDLQSGMDQQKGYSNLDDDFDDDLADDDLHMAGHGSASKGVLRDGDLFNRDLFRDRTLR